MTPERIRELWDLAGGYREPIPGGGAYELIIDELNAPYLIDLIERDFIARHVVESNEKALDTANDDGYGVISPDLGRNT